MNIYSGFVSGVSFVKKKKATPNREEKLQQEEIKDVSHTCGDVF